jgi:hypothetical protein
MALSSTPEADWRVITVLVQYRWVLHPLAVPYDTLYGTFLDSVLFGLKAR